MIRSRLRPLLIPAGIALLLSSCAGDVVEPRKGLSQDRTAADQAAARAPGVTAHAESTQGEPASSIFIDPVTGEPREPTAAELEAAGRAPRNAGAASSATRTKPAAPIEFRLPDGTVATPFPADASQPLQACLHPDGSVDEHCEGETPGAGQSNRKPP